MGRDGYDAHYDWHNPPLRCILPINRLVVSDPLHDAVVNGLYQIRINSDFDAVIEGCAEYSTRHPGTWINPPIMAMFKDLHRAGHAHSVECWQDGALVGGVYGLIPGGSVFCGESMFSRKPRASTVALVHLCARLWAGGFTVLDTQYLNDHTAKLGAFEVMQADYLFHLTQGIARPADFFLRGLGRVPEIDLVQGYLENRQS